MRQLFKRTSLFVGVLAVLVMGVSGYGFKYAYAQQDTNPGSGLRVSPTRSDITIKPGESQEITQNVKNVTQSPITVEPVLNDFESDGVSGEPRLISDATETSAYSLREFVSLPQKFDLQPDEERELTVTLSVPSSAAPGAYFGSVVYRATPQGAAGDGQVALVASVGSLILLEVPGDILEKIEIKSISAYLGESAGSLFTKKPDAIGVMIENIGNGFSQPFGKIQVKDWFGNEVFLYELNDGVPRKNVLPQSTRLFLNDLLDVETKTVNGAEETEKTSPIKWPGRYKVVGNLAHGSTGEVFTVQASFWYIPAWLIVCLVALTAGLVFLAYYLYRKYNIKTARKRR